MHTSNITLAAMLATLTAAAPLHADTSPRVERRDELTYTCVVNAVASNGEYVGAPIPKRSSNDVMGKRQSAENFPSSGGTVAPNSFSSSTGITVGIEGATQSLWSSSDFNVWSGQEQTISTSDTHLPSDITYQFGGSLPTFGCTITYDGVQYDCDTSDDISIAFVSSNIEQSGQVTFPCTLTPPDGATDGATSPGGSGYAPGHCTAHITQYQKADPATDPYTLDAVIYDNAGGAHGSTNDAVSSAYITSNLPWGLTVATGNVDDDPVTFKYADQSWDSNSSQCSVGAYDSGSRQMDCGFDC